MLEDHDIKKIGEIVKAEVTASESRVITAVGEMLEQNVLPLITNLPDKAYLDEKIGNLEGKITAREKKMDYKVNRLVDIQHNRKLISDEEAQELNAIQVFPSAPTVI